MKMLRIFKCKPCKIEMEEFVNTDDKVECSECGKECLKMLSSPRYFGSTTGRSPAVNYSKH